MSSWDLLDDPDDDGACDPESVARRMERFDARMRAEAAAETAAAMVDLDAGVDPVVYRRVTTDPSLEPKCGDLLAAHRRGELSSGELMAKVEARLTSPAPTNLLDVATDAPIAVLGRASPPPDAATVAALDGMMSGPPSTPEDRAAWPVALPRDPVVRATLADDKLVAVFASEDDCRVWVHKMTREVFDGDGDGLLWTKNIEWDEPTIPVTLARVVDCVLERAAVADGSGGLVLAPGAADDVKPREYRVGEEARSAWLARSVTRLRGAVRYRTADPNSLEDEDAEVTEWDEIDVTNDKLARLMREGGAEAE